MTGVQTCALPIWPPHQSLLLAAPQCASSTNFSRVSAPRPPLTNGLKTKLERQRRRRVLEPLRDVSARVRCTAFFLHSSFPCISFIFISSSNTRIIRIHSHLLVLRSRSLRLTTSIPSLSTLQHAAPHASRTSSALCAAGGTTSTGA